MFTTAVLTVGAQAMADEVTHFSIHGAGDTSSSGDEIATPRQVAVWDNVDGGLTGAASFPGPASATRVGYWSAATGGTYLGGVFLTEDGSPFVAEDGADLEVTVIETGYSV